MSRSRANGRTLVTRTTCNNKIKAHWETTLDEAVPADLWLPGAGWTQGWYEVLYALCVAIPDYDAALKFMDNATRDHKDGKLTLTALKAELKVHKAQTATNKTQSAPSKSGSGVKRPRVEDEDGNEDEDEDEHDGDNGSPTETRRKGQASRRPQKKRKYTQGQWVSDAHAEPAQDDPENENRHLKDKIEPNDDDPSDRDEAAEDEDEDLDTPGGIYCIGPSKDAHFLGHEIPKNSKLLRSRELARQQSRIAKQQYRSAPIRGTRHVYRKITSNAALNHWNEAQRGRSTVCKFDTTDEDCSALLQELGDLMRARSFIESRDLTVMKDVDAAESEFIEAIAMAKKSYAEALKQMKFLPRQWRDYTRTEPARHWEVTRELDGE